MIFLRLPDKTEIQGVNNEIIDFTVDPRKNNVAKTFKLEDGEIVWSYESLIPKMIPKTERDIFSQHDFYCVETDNSAIIFQDIDNRINFCTLNEDGEMQLVNIKDLTEDHTLVMFDQEEEEYFYSDVDNVYAIEWSEDFDATFSNYIIHADAGLIINKFLLA